MPINAQTIIQEFSPADHATFVESQIDLTGLEYRNHFPLSFIPSMDWKNIEGTNNPFVAADVVAWGSRAPRKGREFLESLKGELPKIEVARDKTERDLYIIQQLRQAVRMNPGNTGVANQLIDNIYGDVRFTINAVNATLELMSKSLVSTGKYKATLANNPSGVHEVEFDFGIANHGVAVPWGSLSDADNPIDDLKEVQKWAKAKGFSFSTAYLERDTLNNFLGNRNVAAFAAGFILKDANAAVPIVNIDQVNAQLRSQGLPVFQIWESTVNIESQDGTRAADQAWAEGAVYFSAGGTIGQTQYTTTEEFNLNFRETMSKVISDGMILNTVYGNQDPIMVSTKSVAFAFPVLNNIARSFILKTNDTEAWS